ncbi:exopolysaccharide biosynthesis protein [Ferruginivarius sediminum]|uniref:Exopolysaccharide biosynthesis protein n=1 Tax=Ferruginivarius sediminum TaxID=2661937 RepID=A0A369T6S0_9PROT|nr:exopolysaccharide biosynthesis protein [Ferruginivarius sediminum]
MVDKRSLPTLAPTTAELLASFPYIFRDEVVRLRLIFAVLGDRGLASALLLLTAPQLVPMPLGLSNALALPILLVAGQMALGRKSLWLPDWLLDRPLSRDRLLMATNRMVPILRRVEVVIRPRYQWVWARPATHLLGVSCFFIACVSVAPLPLTGWLPALSLIIVALGLLERDGAVVLLGLGIGAVAVAVFALVVGGLAEVGANVERLANGG